MVPPFPVIAQRVLGLVNQSDASSHDIYDVVKLDPSFSAALLRLANSALFGVRREVKSLQQAISLVGLDRVKTIATIVAMDRMVRSSISVAALRKIWIHSLVTAAIAEEAAHLNKIPRDTGYTVGLLHNLGALGLMSSYPKEYARMLEVSTEFGFDLLATERDLFEIDHCLAGCYLAQDWNFPDELAAAIAGHHDDPVPGEATLDNLIRVSWRLADTLGFAAFSPAKDWRYEELIGLLPNKGSWLGESADVARRELDARLAAVSA
jgi:HD-like signal output (HDOD) protein